MLGEHDLVRLPATGSEWFTEATASGQIGSPAALTKATPLQPLDFQTILQTFWTRGKRSYLTDRAIEYGSATVVAQWGAAGAPERVGTSK